MDDVISSHWPPAPPSVLLAPGEVVVWKIDLRGSPDALAAANALTTEPERTRAARYVRERDRVSFLLQRATLRMQLAAQLGISDPRQVEFAHNERGKPRLAQARSDIEFNASGSGEIGLIAFSRGEAVGVDVEKHREVEELDLAQNFFAADEIAELRALPPESRREGFFNAWTRKEAFIKALGQGLYFPLDRFAVSLAPGTPARLRWVDGEAADGWTLGAVPMEPGYAAAVVRRGGPFSLRRFHAPAIQNWRATGG